ncbi:MAG TPA: hypothetical protein VKU03_07240 [Roseiarcus sp.]|nr:hypothetical protein [Roseiarcus sp.]
MQGESLQAGKARRMADLFASATLAFVLSAAPIVLHLISPSLAVAFAFASGFAVALLLERAAPMLILVSFMFQTMFVAMASSHATQFSDLDAMKVYDFVITIGVWTAIAGRVLVGKAPASPFLWRMILASTAILVLAGFYFLAGLPIDSRGAIIYMRNIGLPALLFQICLFVASRNPLAMRSTATLLLALLAICGYFELLDLQRWLDVTNGWHYWDLASLPNRDARQFERQARETGQVLTGTVDFLTGSLFNTDLLSGLDLQVVRLQGPNFHPISFGYSLAVLIAFLAAQGRKLLPLVAAPLLLFVGAKGAVALLIFSLAFCFAARSALSRLAPLGLAGALVLYATFVFWTGAQNGDFHVLGLIGGLKGFLADPIGHTLAEGGNLSTNFAAIDWTKYQHQGSTDIAVESAIGVLFYQMGIAAAGVLAIYLFFARVAWRLFRALRAPALALAAGSIAVILVNGLFQEEALFAPLALGLVMALAGLSFGAADRLVRATALNAPPARRGAGAVGAPA